MPIFFHRTELLKDFGVVMLKHGEYFATAFVDYMIFGLVIGIRVVYFFLWLASMVFNVACHYFLTAYLYTTNTHF